MESVIEVKLLRSEQPWPWSLEGRAQGSTDTQLKYDEANSEMTAK
jgi:hypothetical protein